MGTGYFQSADAIRSGIGRCGILAVERIARIWGTKRGHSSLILHHTRPDGLMATIVGWKDEDFLWFPGSSLGTPIPEALLRCVPVRYRFHRTRPASPGSAPLSERRLRVLWRSGASGTGVPKLEFGNESGIRERKDFKQEATGAAERSARMKAKGGSQYAKATCDLNQSPTSNDVNEITNITATAGAAWVTPVYSKAGSPACSPEECPALSDVVLRLLFGYSLLAADGDATGHRLTVVLAVTRLLLLLLRGAQSLVQLFFDQPNIDRRAQLQHLH